jgi:hypothetical protein
VPGLTTNVDRSSQEFRTNDAHHRSLGELQQLREPAVRLDLWRGRLVRDQRRDVEPRNRWPLYAASRNGAKPGAL